MAFEISRRVADLISLLRSKPFSLETGEGRARERQRRAALMTVAAVLSKALSVVVTFASIRLTVHYLGADRYGVWMTISSFIALLNFVDLGLGNGLVNAVAHAQGSSDRNTATTSVSTTFFIFCGISLGLGVIFLVTFPFIPWATVFNVNSAATASEVAGAVAVLAICFLLTLPLSIVQNVQTGCQDGFLNYMWQVAGNLIALVSIIIAMHLECGLAMLVLASAGGPLVALCLNWLIHFRKKSSRPITPLDSIRQIVRPLSARHRDHVLRIASYDIAWQHD